MNRNMDLVENLKQTLEKTYQLALGLEQVSSMIYPRKIGAQGRKRLLNINREIKAMTQMLRSKPSSSLEKSRKLNSTTYKRPGASTDTSAIVSDSPGYLIKKRLSTSIKEINERVKMSRAGKRTIGTYISKEAVSPPIIRNISSLQSSWQERVKTPKSMQMDFSDEKPQPYVPLTSAKIEDPIVLPTFEEFLQAKGVEFVVRKGKDELFYRIEKAAEKIGKLKEILDLKLAALEEKKRNRKITQAKIYTNFHKPDFSLTETRKNEELRKVMNQYYAMPTFYATQKKTSSSVNVSPASKSLSLSAEAEGGLEESLRDFYRSKAVENRKLTDILDKISKDRPYSIKEKIALIQDDKEKYKNKHHSIEKFNDFRETIEHKKRKRQHRNFSQALGYFEILDDFKRRRYEPSNPELLLLELWRRIIETGWVLTKTEVEEMSSILTEEELFLKPVQTLLDKLISNC